MKQEKFHVYLITINQMGGQNLEDRDRYGDNRNDCRAPEELHFVNLFKFMITNSVFYSTCDFINPYTEHIIFSIIQNFNNI